MDEREKYMTTLIRWLIKHGLITFASAASSAMALGPYGFAVGPALTAATVYFNRGTIQEQINGLSGMSTNGIIKLAFQIAMHLAIQNMAFIIKICKDIIRLLKRLFEVKEESTENVKAMIHQAPF